MRRPPSRTVGTRARLLGLAAVAVLLAACSGEQTMLDPAGYYAKRPDDLFRVTMWIALAVFILVQGLVVYTSLRYRARKDDDDTELPKQVHGNTRLEIVWTLIPALVLASIAVPTVRTVMELSELPDDAMTIEVIGHRWWWEYRYPDSGIITANELVFPEDTNIHLEMRSEETGRPDRGVVHSYWIPALAGKQDVFPGRVTTLNMRADDPGRYLGQCGEYCGLSHANMRNRGVALTAEDFDQWVADQQEGSPVAAAVAEANPDWSTADQVTDVTVPDSLPEQAGDADPQQVAQGWAVFSNNCASCHQIRTDGVASQDDFMAATGPNLTHLMSRKEFAGAIFDLYEREDPDDANADFTDTPNVDQLTAWVRDAPSQKAMRAGGGIGMPSFAALPDADVDAVVAYLLTLD